jgi:hypothetical protein
MAMGLARESVYVAHLVEPTGWSDEMGGNDGVEERVEVVLLPHDWR